MTKSFEHHARTVSVLTFVSRVTGFARESIFSRVFGLGPIRALVERSERRRRIACAVAHEWCVDADDCSATRGAGLRACDAHDAVHAARVRGRIR